VGPHAHTLVYLIGAPGAGKTTLMQALVAKCQPYRALRPFGFTVLACPDSSEAAMLGITREGGFSGTDALSMSVQPKVEDWMRTAPYELVLGEGDRLGNVKFLSAMLNLNWRVNVAHLVASPDLLDIRCAERGSNQSATWRSGRATKVRRVGEWAATNAHGYLPLDAAAPAWVNAMRMVRRWSPLLRLNVHNNPPLLPLPEET
jgi:predicted nucleotide kinase in modified base biosynthesis